MSLLILYLYYYNFFFTNDENEEINVFNIVFKVWNCSNNLVSLKSLKVCKERGETPTLSIKEPILYVIVVKIIKERSNKCQPFEKYECP